MKIRRTGLGLLLVLSLVWGMVATATPDAEAASKTEKVTLITGEKYNITVWLGGNVKSVSTTKKSVISVKKSGTNKVICSAKKAGKATVTIRTVRGAVGKYIFTVKKFKLQAKAVSLHYTEGSVNTTSDVAVEVLNKTGVYINSATVTVNLYNAAGGLLEKKDYTFYDLVSGSKVYKMITYYGEPVARVDFERKVPFSRTSVNKVINMSKKVKVSVSQAGSSMDVKIKNPTKKSVSGSADVIFYSESGEILYIRPCSFYLKAKEVTTTPVSILSGLENASYKIVTRAYART